MEPQNPSSQNLVQEPVSNPVPPAPTEPIQPPPSEIPTTPPPIVHEIPKKKNGFVIFLIILLILVSLGSLGYWAYQKYFAPSPVTSPEPSPQAVVPTATPDVTANWKTYTNTKYSYSLKYPADYSVNENGMGGGDIQKTGWLIVSKPGTDNYSHSNFSVSLIDTPNLENAALQHYNKSSKYQMTQADRETANKNIGFTILDPVIQDKLIKTTVFDLPAYTYTVKSNIVDDGASESIVAYEVHKYIWIQRNNNIFLISYTDIPPTNQILSTFKFNTPECKTGEYLKQCKLGPCCCPTGAICD